MATAALRRDGLQEPASARIAGKVSKIYRKGLISGPRQGPALCSRVSEPWCGRLAGATVAKAICTPLHKKDSIILYDATTGQKLQSKCRKPTFLPLLDPQGHARTMHAKP